MRNKRSTFETYFEPFARQLAEDLTAEDAPLLLVFDVSAVGRGCAALVVSMLYGKCALPLAWSVKKAQVGVSVPATTGRF